MSESGESPNTVESLLMNFDCELKKSTNLESIDLKHVELVCFKMIDTLKQVDFNTKLSKLGIFESILIIIHKSLDAGKDVTELLDILAILIWQVLLNNLSMIFPNIFEIFLNNQAYLQGIQSMDVSGLSNMIDRLLLLDYGYKHLIINQILPPKSLQFIAFLNNLVFKFQEIFEKLTCLLNNGNLVSENDLGSPIPINLNHQLSSLLQNILDLIDCSTQRDLSSLILMNHQYLLQNLVLYKSNIDISHFNKSLIDEILNLIASTLIPKFYKVFIDNTILLPPKKIHYQFFPQQTNSLSNSINFILQVLENGTLLYYLSSQSLCSNLFLTNQQFLKIAKIDSFQLYSIFNSNSSKLSILTTLLYENYLISLNLLDSVSDFPSNIIKKFKWLLLPPLPKSSLDQDLDREINCTYQNHSNLQYAQIFCLDSLKIVLKNELNSIEALNQYSSNTLDNKILINVIDSLLCSLCVSLIINNSTEENDLLFTTSNQLVYEIIKTMMQHETKSVTYSLKWVALFNIINEFCHWNFSLSPAFIQLLDYLAEADMIKTKAIKEATNDFMKRFYNKQSVLQKLQEFVPNHSSQFIEISLEDLMSKFTTESNPTDQSVTKPSESTFSSSVARRQSVHVDEYEKTKALNK